MHDTCMKTPAEIRRAGQSAKYCSEKLAILQEAWAGCQGEWKRSDLFLKLTSRKSHTSFGARVWMTKSQLTNKYGNAAIADTIIQAKLDDPKLCESCVKWHPDAPGNQELRLYLCWDSEGVEQREDTVVEELFQSREDDDSENEPKRGRKEHKDKKKRRRSSSGAESVSTKSDKSSSDDSSDDKKKKKKAKKGKKDKNSKKKTKKETSQQREKREANDKKKEERRLKQEREKAEREKIAKAKKVLGSANDAITKAANKGKVIGGLCPNLRSAIEPEFIKLRDKLVDGRDSVQDIVDTRDVSDLEKTLAICNKALEDYRDFLTRANLK